MTSVQATEASPPHKEYASANKLKPIILFSIIDPSPTPTIVSNALPPRNKTVVRFTNTKSAIQNTASIVFKLVLNLFSINSGIV